MTCLSDKPRSGAPRQLDETAVGRLVQWAHEKALSAPELLHTEAKGTPVHLEALVRYFKEKGLMWKRIRRSLKKSEMTPFLSAAGRNAKC